MDGGKPPVDFESSRHTEIGRAVQGGGHVPGLPSSSVCPDIGLHLPQNNFCFSDWVIQTLQVGVVASVSAMGLCNDNANAAAAMLRSELPAGAQKSAIWSCGVHEMTLLALPCLELISPLLPVISSRVSS